MARREVQVPADRNFFQPSKQINKHRYNGEIQSFTGQLRCATGVVDEHGKETTILIKSSQLQAKQEKYPNLRVLCTVV